MAILRRCCCFDNTRTGSIACGVYSMIYSVVYLGWWIYQYNVVRVIEAFNPFGFNFSAIYAGYILNFLALSILFVSCIILIIGITKDNKVFLLPYIVTLGLLLFFQVLSWIIWLAILGLAAILLIIDFVFWLGFTSLNIVCLLCVISQYQELQEGRGRIADVNAARSARVVVVHQPGAAPMGVVTTTTYAGNTTVVTAPPGQQPQQGYPPPQPGYPPQQQGYPPQAQGYPPQQPGQVPAPPQQQDMYPPTPGQAPGQVTTPMDPAPSYSQQDPALQPQDQSYPTK